MKKKTITVIKDIFISNDGVEFDDEDNCNYHEYQKKQEDLEKYVEEKLGIKTKVEFPAMLNFRNDHEYRLFLIKNENDLNLFIETYEYWFTDLEYYKEVNKKTFVYPDVLCILDFPTGGDEHRLYKTSQLRSQFNEFESSLLNEINKKILPKEI